MNTHTQPREGNVENVQTEMRYSFPGFNKLMIILKESWWQSTRLSRSILFAGGSSRSKRKIALRWLRMYYVTYVHCFKENEKKKNEKKRKIPMKISRDEYIVFCLKVQSDLNYWSLKLYYITYDIWKSNPLPRTKFMRYLQQN